ncbi:MAG: methionyl-tRNA formyltransferase [Deltaproteobacteria bacterium]
MNEPLRIIFMGTPLFAVATLEALIAAGHKVQCVVTMPDRPKGRGGKKTVGPVKASALRNNIEVLEPETIKHGPFIERLKAIAPDFVVVVAYGKILPQAVLNIPRYGCVNLHASLLPKYRGPSPINRAVINGDEETGVTTMLMDKGMDTGPMLLKERLLIGESDTAEDLSKRLSASGAGLVVRTLEEMRDGLVKPEPQDESEASYAGFLKKEDGRIDWSSDAGLIKNLVRGMYPWPGAYTFHNGNFLKVHRGDVAPTNDAGKALPPGTITGVSDGFIGVACGQGAYNITELQMQGRKRLSSADFLKGYRLKEGDRLG